MERLPGGAGVRPPLPDERKEPQENKEAGLDRKIADYFWRVGREFFAMEAGGELLQSVVDQARSAGSRSRKIAIGLQRNLPRVAEELARTLWHPDGQVRAILVENRSKLRQVAEKTLPPFERQAGRDSVGYRALLALMALEQKYGQLVESAPAEAPQRVVDVVAAVADVMDLAKLLAFGAKVRVAGGAGVQHAEARAQDPRVVREQAAAMYEAVRRMGWMCLPVVYSTAATVESTYELIPSVAAAIRLAGRAGESLDAELARP